KSGRRLDLLHGQTTRTELSVRIPEVEPDLLCFIDRVREADRATVGIGLEARDIERRILLLPEHTETAADPIGREIRIDVGELRALLEITLLHAHLYGATGAQEVLRLQLRADEPVAAAAGADAELDAAKVLLGNVIFHVDL